MKHIKHIVIMMSCQSLIIILIIIFIMDITIDGLPRMNTIMDMDLEHGIIQQNGVMVGDTD
ncbi:unnamed protein product [Onchocerca flexuosa]|uniref:Uncharacterized protein n=1 Tax=Onchocerca flexuosa TaxID=387005 RepID=A0A183HL18_9BILA|nr:unnamed protein product [Onchocerca flexuosa]